MAARNDDFDITQDDVEKMIVNYSGVIVTEDSDEPKLCICIYKNPNSYDEETTLTQSAWNYVTASIRSAQHRFCKGEISKHFFGKDKTTLDTDIIFTLSLFERASGDSRERTRLIGFAMCNDLTLQEDDNESFDTLYIDAICGNTQDMRATSSRKASASSRESTVARESNVARRTSTSELWTTPAYNLNDERTPYSQIKVGKILLNAIELYAISSDFEQMKLSSLSYVINYYRSLGYRHVIAADEPEELAIKRIAEGISKKKYKSEEDVDEQMRIERAIQLSNNNIDRLKENLKLYLDLEEIPDDETTNYLLQFVNKDLSIENVKVKDGQNSIYDLMVKLTTNEFAANCLDTEIPSRRNWLRRVDGEFVTNCIDEGFTMRKSLRVEDGWRQLL